MSVTTKLLCRCLLLSPSKVLCVCNEKTKKLFQYWPRRSSHSFCTMVLLAKVVVCTLVFCLTIPMVQRCVLSESFFLIRWLRFLTCICFCGCEVWVAAGSAFSRGPRAFSLPSELIIYSIYKTLYVQNRKNWEGNKETHRRINLQFFNCPKPHTLISFTMLLEERLNTFPCASA